MKELRQLQDIKNRVGSALTEGLSNVQITRFLELDTSLRQAISLAAERFEDVAAEYPDLIKLPESELMKTLNHHVQGFYDPIDASPYVPLAAKGAWIVTLYGAVVYETGGYGMLGFGHNPDFLYEVLHSDQVMANVMTRSLSQYRLSQALLRQIGFTRGGAECPFEKFLFMNSGSEAMEVAGRLIDIHARKLTDPGAKYAGAPIVSIALSKGFHGRTTSPAKVSDSSRKKYKTALASYRDQDDLLIVEPNNVADLQSKFESAHQQGAFVSGFYMEPVMGEGNPGLSITPEFYARARELCDQHETILIIDSIQASLRAWGVLSIVDFPNFQTIPAPDMESYSKAMNAGQYPLSVLAMRRHIAELYQYGIYGNTMTGNPRALEVGLAVVNQCTPALRTNIIERGQEFRRKLRDLIKRHPKKCLAEQGTGLLVSLELSKDIPVVGINGIELKLRKKGIQVIHGGENSLRFTPQFFMSSQEIELIIEVLEHQIMLF
jgi:acetylornithine/succinyldiaminopimelate/putrescine aminotransferase